jgi:hypothetical protein
MITFKLETSEYTDDHNSIYIVSKYIAKYRTHFNL